MNILCIAICETVRPLPMTDIINSLWDRLLREKNMRLQPTAMFGTLYFLSVPPDVIERNPRFGLSSTFRTVTMRNCARIYSTHQLSLYHSPFHRSPYLQATTASLRCILNCQF